MPRVLTICISTVLMLASLATPVSADTPGCVTRVEYRSVHRGYKMTRVHRIWDTAGHREAYATSGGYAAQVRTYRVCGSRFSAVAASFDRNPGGAWRLSAKSAVWVS